MNDDAPKHIATLALQLANDEPLDRDAVRTLLVENAALRLDLTRAELALASMAEKLGMAALETDVTRSEVLLVRARRAKTAHHDG